MKIIKGGRKLLYLVLTIIISWISCTAVQSFDDINLLNNLKTDLSKIQRDFSQSQYKMQQIVDPRKGLTLYRKPEILKLINKTKIQILETMRYKELSAMDTYVEDYFNDAVIKLQLVSSPFCEDCVSKESIDEAYSIISENSQFILQLKSITVDLYAQSDPDEAHAVLYIRTHKKPEHTTYTNNSFGKVYRGKYESKITKNGYKQGRLPLDLVKNPGKILDCKLAPIDAENRETVCKLVKE